MRLAVLAVLVLLLQRALAMPGFPVWAAEIVLPAVFLVGPPLSHKEIRWPVAALLIGLGWDVLLEEVVGPGAIAWSAAAVVVGAVASVIADRSARAWTAMGALATLVFLLMRHLAHLPLGLGSSFTWLSTLRPVVFTALWCGLVGWVIHLDLPARWRRHRARVLR